MKTFIETKGTRKRVARIASKRAGNAVYRSKKGIKYLVVGEPDVATATIDHITFKDGSYLCRSHFDRLSVQEIVKFGGVR